MPKNLKIFPVFLLALIGSASSLWAEPFVYQIDDGSGNVNVGPPSTFSADMLWGNYFTVEPGAERISEIRVGLGPNYPQDDFGDPLPLTLHLFDDPDNDGNPTNAVPVASTTINPTVFTQSGFNSAPIPPTTISGGFFVAARVFARAGVDRPARLDPQLIGGENAWLFYSDEIDPDNLGSSPFFTPMNDPAFVPIFGVWMVRAVGGPASDCADLNGDGQVDLADLNLVLSSFGVGPGGDVNGDGQTNLADLNAVLAEFGQSCD